jgi:hypothetical protein
LQIMGKVRKELEKYNQENGAEGDKHGGGDY